MDSRDSGCFNSILSNNSQILNSNSNRNSNKESTPIKQNKSRLSTESSNDESSSSSSLLLFTPIRSTTPHRPPSELCLNGSIDIDSVYFSRLKRPKYNIYSQQYSPISSLSSRRSIGFKSEYSSSFIIDLNQSISSSSTESIRIDFLFELNEKSMFHVIKLILNNLTNKDYVKLNRVSRNWQTILNQDLNLNKQRKQAIKKEINFFKTEKVNKFYIEIILNFIFLLILILIIRKI